MKIWELRPADNLADKDNPWEPWYDKAFGFIVMAHTESEARQLAHAEAGDENRGWFLNEKVSNTKTPWLDSNYSTCVELGTGGEPRVIMRDFASA